MKNALLIITLLSLFTFGFSFKKSMTVFIAADSTVKKYNEDQWPQQGWGQVFELGFTKNVTFENRARGGRSTKSFLKEGLWDKIVNDLQKGDVVIIQFGHNDHDKRKAERYTPIDEYKTNLTTFVNDVRKKNGIPILVTPLAMRSFREGNYYDGHGEYPAAMKEMGNELDVVVIDLNKLSGEKIASLGYDKSRQLYMNFDAGVEKNYPEGKTDNTHLSNVGAKLMSDLVMDEIRKNNILPLSKYLK